MCTYCDLLIRKHVQKKKKKSKHILYFAKVNEFCIKIIIPNNFEYFPKGLFLHSIMCQTNVMYLITMTAHCDVNIVDYFFKSF